MNKNIKKTIIKSLEMNLIIDVPKKENSGEDASPILIESENKQISVIGVFDGMGGSGSTLYRENDETHTGAYLASRTVKDAVEDFFKKKIGNNNFSFSEEEIPSLKGRIIQRLRDKLNKQQYEESRIRSSLIRTFPTTIALGITSRMDNAVKIQAIWAGDSRIYFLSPTKGLVQLTKDDLRTENDPFQNIENDSPLSNMVCLDEEFSLNYFEIEEEIESIIVFAATDGCFGYYPTPMHFENIILETMQSSDDFSMWEEKLKNELDKVSGDDFSLSLKGVLCGDTNIDFNQFKERYSERFKNLFREYMEEINKLDELLLEFKEQEAKFKKNIEQYESYRKNQFEKYWNTYKETNIYHLKQMNNEKRSRY